LGVGALSVFGPPELSFLLALALELGSAGVQLQSTGAVEGFDEATLKAFRAAPASLAACRVVAHLDRSVRGSDPRAVNVARVLTTSPSFRVLTSVALARLQEG
jgi:hypothetical protein